MPQDTVFFSRCRPQGADPVDLALHTSRVFIGWPAWRKGCDPVRGKLRESIIDLRCSDEEWAKHYASFDKGERKQQQQNRNFVHSIEAGAIALIPRPDRGYVYAGRVKAPFELLDDPPWGNDYLLLRNEQGCSTDDEFSHLADVAQCCEVEQFASIPFPLIPAWMRRSLLGRSTYGHIHPLSELNLDPYVLLGSLMENPKRLAEGWTNEIAEVERRLVNGIGPNSFEHLCVALLQLEEPHHIWTHVGGSGDGGVDGVGASDIGEVVGLIQCKWSFGGGDVDILSAHSPGPVRQILASLLHPASFRPRENLEFWSRRDIATLVIKHAASLPVATTLRIRSVF